jgi:hypothetical protein
MRRRRFDNVRTLTILIPLILIGGAHAGDPRILTVPSQNDVLGKPAQPIAPSPAQRAIPSEAEPRGDPEPNPGTPTAQQSATDQRGTENAPIVAKVLKSDSEAVDDRKDREQRSRNEWWLTVATIALAVVAVVQAGFFLWQLRLIKQGTKDAAISAVAAKDAANAAKTQAEIALKSLVLGQRPILRVRKVVMRQPDATQIPFLFKKGDTISGDFEVVNVGGAAATITQTWSMVYWTDKGLPMMPPYDGRDPDPGTPFSLSPGFSQSLSFKSIQPMDDNGKAIANRNDGWRLYIMGLIYYVDGITAGGRRNYFCREWQIDPCRFVAVDNADYESDN